MAIKEDLKFKDKALDWIEKLEKTTKLVIDLPDDAKLPNGWGKRELAIHLFSWDYELVDYAENLRKGKTFSWNDIHAEDEDINATNAIFFTMNEDLSAYEAIDTFIETRKELMATYVDIVNNYFQDNESFASYFCMFMHDIHHLKQAGVNVEEFEEK